MGSDWEGVGSSFVARFEIEDLLHCFCFQREITRGIARE